MNTGYRQTSYGGSSGAGAPVQGTFITQLPDGTLTQEQALSTLATGLLKVTTGTGVLSTAVAGTDYVKPTGVAGGQTITGGTAASDGLTLTSTSNATKGAVTVTGPSFTVSNTLNTATDNAYAEASVNGTAAGDPHFRYTIPGGTSWYTGPDNSDSDIFKIGTGNAVGTNTKMALTNSEARIGGTLVVGTVTATPNAIIEATGSSTGAVDVQATNLNNSSPGSQARLHALTGGSGGGDPVIELTISAVVDWTIGLDNSVAGDPFVIAAAASLGTSADILTMATTATTTLVGTAASFKVSTTANTGTDHAYVEAAVASSSAGDPHMRYTVTGGTSWYGGVDNSASTFIFGQGTAVGTTPVMTLSMPAANATLNLNGSSSIYQVGGEQILAGGGGSQVIVGPAGSKHLTYITNNVVRMQITSGGLVSIGANTGAASQLEVQTASDTTNGATAAWDNKFVTIGVGGSTGSGLFFSYNQATNTGFIGSLTPSTSYRNLNIQVAASGASIMQLGSAFVQVGVGAAGVLNSALTVGGNRTVASGASATWDDINFLGVTLTLSGSTNITTATGLNFHTIGAPTYSNATIAVTHAATVYIANAPQTTGGMTITNAYALWIDNGKVRWDGGVAMGGGASATLGTIGGSGPATSTMNAWLPVNVDGNARFIPLWA